MGKKDQPVASPPTSDIAWYVWRDRQLSVLRKRFEEKFSPIVPLAHVIVLPQGDPDYRAYVFLETAGDVVAIRDGAWASNMLAFIRAALFDLDIDQSGTNTVVIEFSSREEVDRKHNGDFYRALR